MTTSSRRKEEVKQYKNVPAPEVETSGIADVMRTPPQGEMDRNTHIVWEGAQYAVGAAFLIRGSEELPRHKVLVEDGAKKRLAMGIRLDNGGAPETILTVSGKPARLSEAQSRVLGSLIQRSIEAGQV